MGTILWILGALLVGFLIGFVVGMGVMNDEVLKVKKKLRRSVRQLRGRSAKQRHKGRPTDAGDAT